MEQSAGNSSSRDPGKARSLTVRLAKGKRERPEETMVPFVQTDVAVKPGNSGGPLNDDLAQAERPAAEAAVGFPHEKSLPPVGGRLLSPVGGIIP